MKFQPFEQLQLWWVLHGIYPPKAQGTKLKVDSRAHDETKMCK